MRCYYLSDLHLESQDFPWPLPNGDVLVVAGDLCHARCLDPTRTDRYSIEQRSRVTRFVDAALASFAHVLLVAGNHDHYDGVFDETADLFRRCLPGVSVLDDAHIDIGGVRFFGTTLWSDFDGRNPEAMHAVRRRMGEYFFVKRRGIAAGGLPALVKFRPEDAADAFDASVRALKACLASPGTRTTVVISHHAPSRQGLNPRHAGNGLDGAYASDLEPMIAEFANVPVWVHGHTHTRRRYRVGRTLVHTNCRGFDGKGACARTFAPQAFDL